MSTSDNKRQDFKLPAVLVNDHWKNKIKFRKFENYLQVYEATTNNQEYKEMRRSIKPSLPFYMYSRHEVSKFYDDNGYFYPQKYKPVDWNVLVAKKKQESRSASSKLSSGSEKKSRSLNDFNNY